MGVGERFYVGQANGPRGMATILDDNPAQGMSLRIAWDTDVPQANPVALLVGLPRPQTARRVLFEAAVWGCRQLVFFQGDKGEPSYAKSKLWLDEWQRHLRAGAEQAFSTTIPGVLHHKSLSGAVGHLPQSQKRLALDVYEGTQGLAQAAQGADSVLLAVGAERGWSAAERDTLRAAGFTLIRLGDRVLKTETALVAGVSVALASMERL